MATEFPIKANTQSAEQSIERLIAALRKAGKEAGMAEKEIDDMVDSTTAARQKGVQNINSMNQGLNNLGNTVKNVAKGAVALFALDQLKNYGREIINITAEFQKFEAVLTNTLGSNSAAQIALRNIQQFASRTPFSVRELTDSFVKLANQGFKPTQEEMRRLGDLAASTGKQFDQLTEAIIDAQTGEFERLKEFGIRASKEGESVTFTFKGVQTQTDFTAESIRAYVLALGDAIGVSGSMAAISETVGGQISNMGDQFDQLLKTLGDGQSGPIHNAITNITWLLSKLTDAVRTNAQVQEQEQQEAQAAAIKQLELAANATGDLNKSSESFLKLNVLKIESLRREIAQLNLLADAEAERNNQIVQEIEVLKSVNQAIRDYVAGVEMDNKKSADAAAAAGRAKRLENLEKEAKAREKINEKLREYLQLNLQDPAEAPGSDVNTLGATNPQSLFGFLFGAELNRIGQGARDEINAADQAAFDQAQLRREIDLEKEISHQAAVRDARRQTLDYSLMAINEVFRSRAIGIQNELTMLQQAANSELQLAGNNKEAKQRIAVEFERKQRELLTKQVAAEQEAALFTTLINMGPGIAKTIGTLGMPAAIPFIAAVAALIGLQQANIRKAQRPRFAATGEFDIDGPGTETSDSIPYFLSKRESVVHARGTKKFGDIIQPIIEDAATDWHDIKRIVDMKLPGMSNMVVVQPHVRDTGELVQELREVKRAIQNKKEWHWNITEEGLRLTARQGDAWDTYVNKRYSSD